MKFNIYEVIYLILVVISIGRATAKHNEPETGTYNGWTALISAIITIGLLYMAGLFHGN